jgi:hypothetical protein
MYIRVNALVMYVSRDDNSHEKEQTIAVINNSGRCA